MYLPKIHLPTKNWDDRIKDGRLVDIFVNEKWHFDNSPKQWRLSPISKFFWEICHTTRPITFIFGRTMYLPKIHLPTKNWDDRTKDAWLVDIFVWKMTIWQFPKRITPFANFPSFSGKSVTLLDQSLSYLVGLCIYPRYICPPRIGMIGSKMADWQLFLLVKNDNLPVFQHKTKPLPFFKVFLGNPSHYLTNHFHIW